VRFELEILRSCRCQLGMFILRTSRYFTHTRSGLLALCACGPVAFACTCNV
jgi:hypothetical protein